MTIGICELISDSKKTETATGPIISAFVNASVLYAVLKRVNMKMDEAHILDSILIDDNNDGEDLILKSTLYFKV